MLDKQQVEKAVSALLTLCKKSDTSTNIVDQPEKIDLQLTLKVIPKVKHKTIKLDLPHSIHYETREVCLFVKDLDKTDREYEKTVQHYQDLLRQNGITCISKIIPLKALRTDYSMYAAKRSLAKAYDLYLADGAVFGTMPGVLGKIFFAKKKTWPVQVNLRARDLKKELHSIVNNSRCIVDGKGSSCMSQVAHDRMSEEEIVSNVLAATDQIAEKLDGGGANIRNLHIKCSSTTAVPVYMNFGDAGEVEMPEYKQKLYDVAVDDVTTVEKGHVYVRADGAVRVIKRKAKQENAMKQETDADNDVDKTKSSKKKKKLDIKQEEDDSDDELSKKKKRKPVVKKEMGEQDLDNSDVEDQEDVSAVLKDKRHEKDEKPVKNKRGKKETISDDKKGEGEAEMQKKNRKSSKKRYFEKKLKTEGTKSKGH